MKLTHEEYDQISVFSLNGDFDADQSDLFRTTAEQCMHDSVRDFVIDMTDMEFIDSNGLESLLWLQEQCSEKLGQVRLAGVNNSVKTILEMTRLATRFDRHDQVEGAIKSLRI